MFQERIVTGHRFGTVASVVGQDYDSAGTWVVQVASFFLSGPRYL